ncbi:hypothetical protein D3C86_1821210 [compost metagenome]
MGRANLGLSYLRNSIVYPVFTNGAAGKNDLVCQFRPVDDLKFCLREASLKHVQVVCCVQAGVVGEKYLLLWQTGLLISWI